MPSDSPLDPRLTEQRNPDTAEIDQLTHLQIVDVINAEDSRVAPAVHAERLQIARGIELVEAALRAGGRLIYVGAGTSGRLGVLDAAEMPPTFGFDPERIQGVIAGGSGALVRAVEGAEDHPEPGAREMDAREVGPDDIVFGIASSGSTPFVHGALRRAKERGARTGFILCTPPSEEILAMCDVVIAPLVGPEVVTGSTRMKAGTATKMVLNTISTGAMIRLGKTWGNLMVDLRATNLKLQDRSERILMEVLGLSRGQATELLDGADGSVKTAIAMYWMGTSAEVARRRLQDADGHLTRVLEPGGENGG